MRLTPHPRVISPTPRVRIVLRPHISRKGRLYWRRRRLKGT